MDTILQKYLEDLKAKVGQMGGLVEDSLKLALKSLASKDKALLSTILENEDRINQAHKEIDYAVFKLLARQAPVASDLRLILSISKINMDLERMGDLTRNIAYCIGEYLEAAPVLLASEISKMADLVGNMVAQTMQAFLDSDHGLAQEVLKIDDSVDTFRDSLLEQLTETMKLQVPLIDSCLGLRRVIRNLERIGDHATNISEDVIFILTGKDVRHEHGSDKKEGPSWVSQ